MINIFCEVICTEMYFGESARTAAGLLESAGCPAYYVGGCLRDALMGNPVHDIDIACGAAPERIREIFKGYKIIEYGIKHGTVTLMMGGMPYEITAFRVDGKYSDGRRPDDITFTPNLEDDLSRRDFTINAMAYSPKHGLVDLFEGMKDIERRVIRCVGSAEARFSEDYLRIMRAYRFAARLDFSLDAELKEAALKLREHLNVISAERIRAEFDKILLSASHERVLEFMDDLGSVIIPEVGILRQVPQKNKYHRFDVYGHHQ